MSFADVAVLDGQPVVHSARDPKLGPVARCQSCGREHPRRQACQLVPLRTQAESGATKVAWIGPGDAMRAADGRRHMGRVAGRNEPCPCASGQKFKRCCGR